jgi:hypothetical protein
MVPSIPQRIPELPTRVLLLPSMLFASVLFGKLGPKLRGGLQKLAALFVIALGVSTLWQGLRFYLVMYKLVV